MDPVTRFTFMDESHLKVYAKLMDSNSFKVKALILEGFEIILSCLVCISSGLQTYTDNSNDNILIWNLL